MWEADRRQRPQDQGDTQRHAECDWPMSFHRATTLGLAAHDLQVVVDESDRARPEHC